VRPEPRPAGAPIPRGPFRGGPGALDDLRASGFAGWLALAGFAFAALVVGVLAGIEPTLAIGVTLGLAFALLAFVNLPAALVVFTFLAFLEFALPTGAAVSFSKGAGLLLAMAWIARVVTSRDEETFFSAHPATTYLMLAYLGWGVLSLTWTESTSETLVDLSRYLLNFALLVITFTAVRTRTAVMAIFTAWVVGTAVTALYGLINSPTGDPAEAVRLESSVGNANVLATILVAGLVLAIGTAAAARFSPMLRLAATGTAVLALFSFVFTGSRSGVIALVVVVIAAVVVAGRRWRGRALLGALALTLTAVVFFAAFAPADIRDRIAQTVPGQVPDTEGRSTLWQVGWRMVEDHPVRGVGLGSFQSSSIHYLLEPGSLSRSDQIIDTPKVAHNIYLQALAEQGVIGLLMLCGILAIPVACALRAARNFARAHDLQMEIMARALVVALAGILAADFFASEQFNKLLWLLLGMGPAMLAISLAGDQAPDSANSRS
jgi:O-antigen ligase